MYPELAIVSYSITEKLHGTNFQIAIDRDGLRFGRRTDFLSEDSSFYNYHIIKELYADFIEKIQIEFETKKYKTLRFYGEYFGYGIGKGVDYGTERYYRIFDIAVNDIFLPPKEVIKFLEQLNEGGMYVPFVGIKRCLEEALTVNSEFNSKIMSNIDDNICEGIVIRPHVANYENNDSRFCLKTKNTAFLEKSSEVKGIPKPVKEMSELYHKLSGEFNRLININRVESTFSKEGVIDNIKDTGKYIKLITNDCRDDFLKAHLNEFKLLKKDEAKAIFSPAGKAIAEILRNYL